MLWLIVASGVMGLLLGLWFRVPALVVATAVVVALNIALSLPIGWSKQTVVLTTLASLGALEGSYLVGLFLSYAWSRAKRRVRMVKRPGLPNR